jgi:hypothetical protein
LGIYEVIPICLYRKPCICNVFHPCATCAHKGDDLYHISSKLEACLHCVALQCTLVVLCGSVFFLLSVQKQKTLIRPNLACRRFPGCVCSVPVCVNAGFIASSWACCIACPCFTNGSKDRTPAMGGRIPGSV